VHIDPSRDRSETVNAVGRVRSELLRCIDWWTYWSHHPGHSAHNVTVRMILLSEISNEKAAIVQNSGFPLSVAVFWPDRYSVSILDIGCDLCRDRSAFDRNPLKLWALMANKSTLSPYKDR
jgi:hypothetical protein